MKTLTRAWLYVSRKKSRTLILFAILLALFFFIFIGLSLRSSADNEIEKMISELGGSFTVAVNEIPESKDPDLWEYVGDIPDPRYIGPGVDNDVIAKIMETPGIVEYTTFAENDFGLVFETLSLFPGSWSEAYELDAQVGADPNLPLETLWAYAHTPHTIYAMNSELHEYFRQGAFVLTEGRHIKPDDKGAIMISEDLAERNGLKIGDSVTASCNGVYNWQNPDPTKNYGDLAFKVVGLFDIGFKQEPSGFTTENMFAENFVFADYHAHSLVESSYDIKGITNTDGYNDVTFIVDNPSSIDSILQTLKEREDIEWKYYTIEKDDFLYRNAITPIEKIKNLSTLMIAILSVGCALILFLIISMWTKARRKEIGILMSLGIKKKSVFTQFFSECFIICAVSIILAILIAGAVLPYISKSIDTGGGTKEFEVVADESWVIEIEQTQFESRNLSLSSNIASYTGAALIGLGVIVVSAAGAVIPVLRQKPKDILNGS